MPLSNPDGESFDTCSVCLEQHDATSVTTKCGHKFHEDCLLEWVLQDHKQRVEYLRYMRSGGMAPLRGTCPVCRGKLANVFYVEKVRQTQYCTIT